MPNKPNVDVVVRETVASDPLVYDENHEPYSSHIQNVLQFFRYEHLPPGLREVSLKFADLAISLARSRASNPEQTVALRKLLEAKEAAVRARMYSSPVQRTSKDVPQTYPGTTSD